MIHWIHVLRVCVYQREFVRLITQDKWWRVKSDLIFFNISASQSPELQCEVIFSKVYLQLDCEAVLISWLHVDCSSASRKYVTCKVQWKFRSEFPLLCDHELASPEMSQDKDQETSMFSVNVLYFHQLGLFGSVYGKNFHVLIDLITSHFFFRSLFVSIFIWNLGRHTLLCWA